MSDMHNKTQRRIVTKPTKASLGKSDRQLRLVDLMVQGVSVGEAAEQLGVSRMTILRDRRELGERPITDELLRRQLQQIDQCSDLKTQLEYRDRLLSKLLPRKSTSQVDANIKNDLPVAWVIERTDGKGGSTVSVVYEREQEGD